MSATESPLSIAVILASTREGRIGERVARWIHRVAAARPELAVELLDLKDYPLPFFALPGSPRTLEANYADDAARRWVAAIGPRDGFIIVTPEYNHAYPAVLKNALDYAYAGWMRKPVAFVSYGGSSGGVRAVQQLRQVVIELRMIPVRDDVGIRLAGLAADERGWPTEDFYTKRGDAMANELVWWTRAAKDLRARPR